MGLAVGVPLGTFSRFIFPLPKHCFARFVLFTDLVVEYYLYLFLKTLVVSLVLTLSLISSLTLPPILPQKLNNLPQIAPQIPAPTFGRACSKFLPEFLPENPGSLPEYSLEILQESFAPNSYDP